LSLEAFSDRETGDEEGIDAERPIRNTISLRLPARATSASAPVATTGNAVCRAISSEAPGAVKVRQANKSPSNRQPVPKFFQQKSMKVQTHETLLLNR